MGVFSNIGSSFASLGAANTTAPATANTTAAATANTTASGTGSTATSRQWVSAEWGSGGVGS